MREPVSAFVALGANLGQPQRRLRQALAALARTPGIALVCASSLYRSAPVDAQGPDYINAVAELATTLTAPALLEVLQGLERAAGRQRPYHHAPRTLDLDLLQYGSARIDSPQLTLPHPRLHLRAFVLVPWAEIAPAAVSAAALEAVAGQDIERLPCARL